MQVCALPKGQGTVIPWRELLCVWGEQGWLWVTCRRVVTCSQLCSTSHTGCLVTLHSYTPRVQHRTAVPPGCSGSGLPHPANLFSFKWKECHKTPGSEIRLVSLPQQGSPAYPTWENTPKYYYYFKCETASGTSCLILQSLFKVQPVIRSVSCSPGRGSSSGIEVLATGILFRNIHSNGIWQDWRNKGAQEKTQPSFRSRKRFKKPVSTIEKRKEETAFLRIGSVSQRVCVIWGDRVKEVAAGQHREVSRAFANMTQTPWETTYLCGDTDEVKMPGCSNLRK